MEIIKRTTTSSKKIISIFLVLIMFLISVLPSLSLKAMAADNINDAETQSKIDEVREILNAIPYSEYYKLHTEAHLEDKGKLPYGNSKFTLTADNIEKDLTEFSVTTYDNYEGMSGKSFLSPDEGTVYFKFAVKAGEEGLYNLAFTYYPVEGKSSSVERMIKIDNKVPFKEARYLTFTKAYRDNYVVDEATGEKSFVRDIKDNEIRPTKSEYPEWRTVLTEDSSGFYQEPFLYYLTEGEHIIALETVKEPVIIQSLDFYVADITPTYEEYKAANSGQKKGTAEPIKIQAEKPVAVSEIVIYPLNDRTSPISEPQDASRIRLNSIGGDKWQMYGQWIRYEFEIPQGADGMYQIVPRFKQSIYSGVYSSRKIRIDGVLPFKEATKLRFNFNDEWQVATLNDGETEFEFYLSAGHHVLEFEVSLGDMADVLREIQTTVENLNEMYRKIRMITGASPDAYRDYGFERLIPDVLLGMEEERNNIQEISNNLAAVIGGKGEHTVILDKIALQLDRMVSDTDKIASGMDTFKANIGGLSTWLLERRYQPLELDYILIQNSDADIPKANAGFFKNMSHEISSFIMSFFADYTTVGVMTEIDKKDKDKIVNVWMTSGRDQSQIIRTMVDDSFASQTNILTSVKLVAADSLLPATLAGVGPDISLSNTGDIAINYAIRNAVLPLNDFKGDPSKNVASFEEVKTWFTPAALKPLTLQDETEPDKSKLKTYGLPENQTFPMMFYRKDVLVELNVDVPKTWDDLFDVIPILQKKNLEVGVTPGLSPLLMFMFQQKEALYLGDGIEVNLNSNTALDAFKTMCSLYTIYKFPITFDFANRFRSGEMPIGIANYDTYNQLMVFAPEIRGLWEFVPLPGTVRERTPDDSDIDYESAGGNLIIDNTSPAGVTSVIMMKTAEQRNNTENAWAFMQWWVGAEAQGRFGNEMVAIMGAAAKQPTANIEALAKMPWPTSDYKNLSEQFKSLEAVPEVPGGYIVGRYVDFAWKNVYNNGASAVETMQDYIDEINKELSRKRNEFGMEVIERDKFGRRLDGK